MAWYGKNSLLISGSLGGGGGGLAQNIIGYWKLDETAGTRSDSTGNGWHMSEAGVGAVGNAAGKINLAADFSTTNWLSAGNSVPSLGNSSWSMSAWVYMTNKAVGRGFLARGDAATGPGSEFLLRYESGADRFSIVVYKVGAIEVTANNFGSPSINTWYFLAAWYDGANVYISVNNGTPDSSAYTLGSNTTTENLQIGALDGGSQTMSGRIDEVLYRLRPFTASEITQLYNGGSGLSYPF